MLLKSEFTLLKGLEKFYNLTWLEPFEKFWQEQKIVLETFFVKGMGSFRLSKDLIFNKSVDSFVLKLVQQGRKGRKHILKKQV